MDGLIKFQLIQNRNLKWKSIYMNHLWGGSPNKLYAKVFDWPIKTHSFYGVDTQQIIIMTLTYSRNKVRRNYYATNILKTKLTFMHVATMILFFKRKNYRGEWLDSFAWEIKTFSSSLTNSAEFEFVAVISNRLSKTCNDSIILTFKEISVTIIFLMWWIRQNPLQHF